MPGSPDSTDQSAKTEKSSFNSETPSRVDVLILGNGPAGCAVAIKAAELGLRVAVVDKNKFPRERLGECFQPSIENLLSQLGIGSPSNLSTGAERTPSNWVQEGLAHRFESAAEAAFSPVTRFRPFFGSVDLALFRKARDLGVEFFAGTKAEEPFIEGGRITGIRTDKGVLPARFVIDAGGSCHWLANKLKLRIQPASPTLSSITGYAEGQGQDVRLRQPMMKLDSKGWTWMCQVGSNLYKWTRVSFARETLPTDWLPPELRNMVPRGSRNPVDVTWRSVNQPCGPGYFLVGDSAAVLDPASSQGVVKALMGAMLVSHLLPKILQKEIQEASAMDIYSRSMANWFRQEINQLRTLYSVFPEWQDNSAPSNKSSLVGAG